MHGYKTQPITHHGTHCYWICNDIVTQVNQFVSLYGQHMRDCLQQVQTNIYFCACIFPNTLISGAKTSLQPQLMLLLYSLMLMPKQILEISCYIFEILQVINSLCSIFMTAILLMMLFIMFCSSHLAILAGMISCLSTMPEVMEHLLKMSIIYIDCMSAQMNPLHYCLGGSFSSNLLWIHGHTLSRVGYHGSDITKESFVLPNSMGLWMLPMLGIISVMLASPSSCLQATLAVHGACSNSARIHMPLLLPLGPSQTFLLLQLPTPSGKIFGWLYSMGRLGMIVLILLHRSSISKWRLFWMKSPRRGSLEGQWPTSIPLSSRSVGSPICTSSFFLMLLPNPSHQLKLMLLFVLSSLIQILSHISITLSPKS